jgi:hypothetical protein
MTMMGCGPIEYVNQVNGKSARAVAAAKQAGGERHAPYEYTSAVEYLHKAREEGSYAQYQVALEYGRRSEEFALKARAIADETSQVRPTGAAAGMEPAAAAEGAR